MSIPLFYSIIAAVAVLVLLILHKFRKKAFDYLKPLWEGKDGRISLKNVICIGATIDLIINCHKSVEIVYKVIKLSYLDKTIDFQVVTSVIGGLSGIAMIIGIEAAIVGALLGISSWTNIAEKKIEGNTTTGNAN